MRGIAKRVAATLVMVSVAMVARATEEVWDVIETSRGEKVECIVVEVKIGESVRLRMKDGQEMTLPIGEVRRIEPRAAVKVEEGQQRVVKERRFVRHTGMSFAVGPEISGAGECVYAGVGLQVGYRPLPGLLVGVGAMPSSMGSEANYEPFRYHKGFFAIPVYALAKYEFIRRTTSPYISTRVGAMMIDGGWMQNCDKVESGLYLQVSAGVRIAVWKLAISPYAGGSYVGIDAIREQEFFEYRKFFGSMGVMIEF